MSKNSSPKIKEDKEAKRKRKKEEKRQRKKQKLEATEEGKEEEKKEAEQKEVDREKKEKRKKEKKDKKQKKDRKKKKESDSSDNDEDKVNEKEQEAQTNNNNNNKMVLNEQHQAERKALGAKPSEIVASSAIEFYDQKIKEKVVKEEITATAQKQFKISLLLFYQYVEPVWDDKTYQFMMNKLQQVGKDLELTGRMRVAKEGVNCTLTGSHENIVKYCKTLRSLRPKEFAATEFKLTNDLPLAQKFPNLKVFKVVELVHYGLEGPKAPPIAKFSGIHLEPKDYHQKLGESNTVIIDVRNHYEAAIGRFVPPQDKGEGATLNPGEEPPKWLDPMMRKSTEFPVWLDKPEVKEEMKGKQVLMYCTGMLSILFRKSEPVH